MGLPRDPPHGLCYENWGALRKVFTPYNLLEAYKDVGQNADFYGVLSEPSILFTPTCIKTPHVNSKQPLREK